MASVVIKNMLGFNQDWNLEINSTAAGIESKLVNTYNYIVEYFNSDDNTTEAKINAANNILSILSDGSNKVDYYGSAIYDTYNNLNKEKVYSIINGNDNQTSLRELIILILLFSIFDFKLSKICFEDGELPNKAYLNREDANQIYTYTNVGEGNGYAFLPNNRLFKLLDNIYGDWREIQVSCEKEKTFLGKLLEDGYYYNKKKKQTYILFPDEEKEYEVINFIFTFLTTTNWGISTEISDHFCLTNSVNFVSKLSEKIQTTLKIIIDSGNQINRNSEVKEVELGDLNTPITLRFTASENDTIIKYIGLYDYSINLFKRYIDKLFDEKVSIKKDGKTDEYLDKLFDKIIGGNYNQTDFRYTSNSIEVSWLKKYFAKNSILSSFDTSNLEILLSSKCDLRKTDSAILKGGFEILNSTNSKKELERLQYLKNDFNFPIQFYETVLYKITSSGRKDGLDKIREEINTLNMMDGSIISKLSFFTLNETIKINPSEELKIEYNEQNSDIQANISNYKFIKKYQYDTIATVLKINGKDYKNYVDVYTDLAKLVRDLLIKYIDAKKTQSSTEEKNNQQNKESESFNSYVKSRFANGYFTEEDFFYLDDGNKIKRAPINTFVDVEFRVPKYVNGHLEAEWLPVTAIRDYSEYDNDLYVNPTNDEIDSLHAGTYFNSMELEDKAGVKEITLTLKSVNDLNLENIIFYSLSVDQKVANISLGTDVDDKSIYLDQILKDCESNFRVRFGYRDRIRDKEKTITSSDSFSEDFIDRTNIFKDSYGKDYVKPVQTYPWTYFKITGIQSNIKDGEDTYTINGVSSGSYLLNNLSLSGIQSNFSGKDEDTTGSTYKGTPKNVVGKLAKWITQASCTDRLNSEDISSAQVVFLGDEPGTIITDFDGKKFLSTYKYELRNGRTFNGGNIESIENFFFDSTRNNLLTAKNFNIDNNSKLYSVKEILDNLVEWLPERVYYITKVENQTAALHLRYEDVYNIPNFFSEHPTKSEKIKYQIIEADAYIYKPNYSSPIKLKGGTAFDAFSNNGTTFDVFSNNAENKMFHKVYFIRMYYEGPGIVKNSKNNGGYLRVYNYRSVQNQVIENIEISDNNAELGNLISSVSLLGAGTPMVFTYNKQKGKLNQLIFTPNGDSYKESQLNNSDRIKTIGSYESYFTGKPESELYPYFVLNNSKYVMIHDADTSNLPALTSNKTAEASDFFTSQMNKEYTGEMTIMGDPFYFFDSTVEAGKYEIYLQMNRVADRRGYKMKESKYTGIYCITGIKHTIDESGKYTTTLSLIKRIFGTNSDETKENK